MRFVPLELEGAFLIEPERREDARGYFARTFCEDELAEHGLETRFPQHSDSYNAKAGTLRGMHWQAGPREEAKIVSCTRGAIFDVIVDVRDGSRTEGQWVGLDLDAESRRSLYVPKGFAHGFLSRVDQATVHYLISERYQPEGARGFRWDDPEVGIDWPSPPVVISERDAGLPAFKDRSSE